MKAKIAALAFLFVGAAYSDEPAKLIGPISDGTPPAPVPPIPRLDVQPQDVVDSRVQDLGTRKITIQKIVPFELPPIPEPPQPVEPTAEEREQLAALKAAHEEQILLMMSVTVYRSEAYPGKVRTQFRWWSQDRSREFEAWSNVDGNWLSGFASFESGGRTYSLLFGIGEQDVDQWTRALASKGRTYTPPQIPPISLTDPAFVVTKGNPSTEELAPIQAIHNLVKAQGETLRLAYEGRKQAQKEREDFLKAHPIKPADIVLNYWRIPKAPPVAPQEGGRQ